MTALVTKPPPPQRTLPLPPPTPNRAKISFSKIGEKRIGHRVLLYGTGGIGKTTLACHATGPVAFYDLDESLDRLEGNLSELTPHSIKWGDSWASLRASLQADGWNDIQTIVIDTLTKAEELAIAHTLATVKGEKNSTVTSIEGYGYGKGYQYVYETFLPLLADLDRHAREGRNVILICHECVSNVPNPVGDDWIRYEPRLQNPSSGKSSIRLRTKEWADHCLFMAYDVAVSEEGKGKGSGTRTLWPGELPHCMAKSRSTQDPIPVNDPADVWTKIITK